MTRPTLRELALSRGYDEVRVVRPQFPKARWCGYTLWRGVIGAECLAKSRAATVAGLRAALLAMPKTKEKKR